mmetsp:Transcript_2439/g.2725  ORF Transcript_2439/g.2725 Transcript_2439/m.2725 type:complete len:147 (-) Transcript_2439:102-542(-)
MSKKKHPKMIPYKHLTRHWRCNPQRRMEGSNATACYYTFSLDTRTGERTYYEHPYSCSEMVCSDFNDNNYDEDRVNRINRTKMYHQHFSATDDQTTARSINSTGNDRFVNTARRILTRSRSAVTGQNLQRMDVSYLLDDGERRNSF